MEFDGFDWFDEKGRHRRGREEGREARRGEAMT